MIVAMTGHRPDKLGGYTNRSYHSEVFLAVGLAIRSLQVTKVITGMAQGVDTFAAEYCAQFDIPYTAAIPFLGQECRWPQEAQAHYAKLLVAAQEIKVVCSGSYGVWKMQKRNEWMVDHCDVLLAVWDGSSGGTKNCIDYAKKVGKKIYHLPIINTEGILSIGLLNTL